MVASFIEHERVAAELEAGVLCASIQCMERGQNENSNGLLRQYGAHGRI